MSNSFWPHGLRSPWTSLGQNTGMGSCFLLQGIFPTQGLNPGLLHCRWILYQLSHQEALYLLGWLLLKDKKKIELSYDPAIPFLDTYLKKTKTLIWKDTCIPMFTAALFTTAKTWKQHASPLTEKWMNVWCIYIKWNIIQSLKQEWNNAICSNIDGPRDYHTKWSKPKTNIIWYHLYVESKKLNTNKHLQNRNRYT